MNTYWREKEREVIARMSQIVFWGLVSSMRAHVINTYCFPMILFLLRFVPPPPGTFKRIQEAAKKAIYKGMKSHPAAGQLTTPRKLGGLGLQDLIPNLAKMVYLLVTVPTSRVPLWIVSMRTRLQLLARSIPPYLERREYRLQMTHSNHLTLDQTSPQRQWPALFGFPIYDEGWRKEWDHQEVFLASEFSVLDMEAALPPVGATRKIHLF